MWVVVHSEHERTAPPGLRVLLFEAILRMGCSKLGCKISTLGALSAGQTEAPPGSKLFLEMDIGYSHTYVCDYICIYCALYCVRAFFVYGCVGMIRKCIVFAACRRSLCSIIVSMRNLKCTIHIHHSWSTVSLWDVLRCVFAYLPPRLTLTSINPNAINISYQAWFSQGESVKSHSMTWRRCLYLVTYWKWFSLVQ